MHCNFCRPVPMEYAEQIEIGNITRQVNARKCQINSFFLDVNIKQERLCLYVADKLSYEWFRNKINVWYSEMKRFLFN